jgi:hypothetical protein
MLTDVLIPPARTGRNEAAGDGGDGVEPKPTPGQTHNRHLPAPHRPMRSLPTVIRSGSSGHQPGVSAIAGPWPLTPVEPGVTCRPGVPWRTAMGNAPGVRCHGTGLRTDRFTMRLRCPSICTNRSTAHGFSRWRLGQGRRHDLAEADAVPVHDPERLLREVGDMGLVTRRHCRSSRQSQVRRYRGPPDNAST